MIPEHSLPPPRTGPSQILVVDDDEARRDMFVRVLSFEGYAVKTLSDGDHVLDHVRANPPDLIILDVLLPGASGFEICGDLRMMDESRLIPIIMVSAACDDERSVVQGLLSGADDYLCTPRRLEELKARVRVQLRNRRDRELLQWARQQRASFREAAMCDALTGIPNRRAGERTLNEALESSEPLMAMLVDVDHFKRINDTYGHAAGDGALKKVATCLDRLARKGDMVARFGGEEFLVVIRGALPELAGTIGERFRAAVERLDLQGVLGDDSVTISVGVATWPGVGDALTREGLLRAADEALYEAKGKGRNRVAVRHVAGGDGKVRSSKEWVA